jgi:phospholipase/carboxylesterase
LRHRRRVGTLGVVTVRHVERPAAGAAVGALVFFHGYGGAPEEWLPFIDKLDPERRFHGYLPEAPHLDRDGNRSWFPRGSPDTPDTQVAPVVEWLAGLQHRRRQTVIAGWSQGTNLAYALALGPGLERPAGLVALAGGFRDELPPDLERPPPPVLIAHGRTDDAVPVSVARHARDALERAGAAIVYCETDVGHEVDQAVVPKVRDFLARLPLEDPKVRTDA